MCIFSKTRSTAIVLVLMTISQGTEQNAQLLNMIAKHPMALGSGRQGLRRVTSASLGCCGSKSGAICFLSKNVVAKIAKQMVRE